MLCGSERLPYFTSQSNTITMKTNNVLELVAEYQADPNCRADLWINDCLQNGEVTKDERNEFLLVVMINTWQRAFSKYSHADRVTRLRELLTWDKPRQDNDIEHTAKIKALQNLTTEF